MHGEKVFLIADHFSSKGGDNPLFGRWQPPVRSSEQARHAQAQVVNDFVDELVTADSHAEEHGSQLAIGCGRTCRGVRAEATSTRGWCSGPRRPPPTPPKQLPTPPPTPSVLLPVTSSSTCMPERRRSVRTKPPGWPPKPQWFWGGGGEGRSPERS